MYRFALPVAASFVVAAVVLAGCTTPPPGRYHSGYDAEYMDNPFPGITKIAIVPFENLTGTSRSKFTVDLEDSIATELTRYKDIVILRAVNVRRFIFANDIVIRDSEDLLDLGRKLKVDIVIAAAITDYKPYKPPRIGLALQVYATSDSKVRTLFDVESWSHSGVPYPFTGAVGSRFAPILEMEFVCDASLDTVRHDIVKYVQCRETNDNSYTDFQSCLNIMPEFARFFSDRLIRKIIDMQNQRARDLLAEEEKRKRLEAGETRYYEKDAWSEYMK